MVKIEIKVGGASEVKKVASSIFLAHTQSGADMIIISAIGAASVNQAIKGVIAAKKELSSLGKETWISPDFADFQENDKIITGIKLNVYIKDRF